MKQCWVGRPGCKMGAVLHCQLHSSAHQLAQQRARPPLPALPPRATTFPALPPSSEACNPPGSQPTWILSRLVGHRSSQQQSMMAWHTARSLNMGNWMATCGAGAGRQDAGRCAVPQAAQAQGSVINCQSTQPAGTNLPNASARSGRQQPLWGRRRADPGYPGCPVQLAGQSAPKPAPPLVMRRSAQ